MEILYVIYGEINGKKVGKFTSSSLWMDSDGASKVYHALNCKKIVVETYLDGRHGLTMSIDITGWDGEHRYDVTPNREFKEIAEWAGLRSGKVVIEKGAA